MKWDKVFLILSIMVIILGTIIYFSTYYEKTYFPKSEELISYDYLISKCETYDFPNDLECVRSYFKQKYIYVISDDSIDLSYEELLTIGGDCNDWAKLWHQVGESLDYESFKEVVQINKTNFHVFNILSNPQGYCLIDQTILTCSKY